MMKKSILKTVGVVGILVLIAGDKIGNSATDLQTAKYQEPEAIQNSKEQQEISAVVVIEDEPVALTANPFGEEKANQSVSDNAVD